MQVLINRGDGWTDSFEGSETCKGLRRYVAVRTALGLAEIYPKCDWGVASEHPTLNNWVDIDPACVDVIYDHRKPYDDAETEDVDEDGWLRWAPVAPRRAVDSREMIEKHARDCATETVGQGLDVVLRNDREQWVICHEGELPLDQWLASLEPFDSDIVQAGELVGHILDEDEDAAWCAAWRTEIGRLLTGGGK